jgi:hypothetical protein
MHKDAKALLADFKGTLAARQKWLREINDTTQSSMGREMKAGLGEDGVGQKTVSNVENLSGDHLISTYAAVAAYWGLPLWAMTLPGTTRDMFEDITKMHRLVQLMTDYLDCSDERRLGIEGTTSALADLTRSGK